jgi:hypothetical protein
MMEVDSTVLRPGHKAAQKALKTARWARIMTKWLIRHSSKGGVKWQLVDFNGKKGQESKGIVDLIAIRKDHKKPEKGGHRGDLFEIVLIQVKGGSANFPSADDLDRLRAVKQHHRAGKVVLAEWKQATKLCLYVLPNLKDPVDATKIFGKLPKITKDQAEAAAKLAAKKSASPAALTPGQKAAATKKAKAEAANSNRA